MLLKRVGGGLDDRRVGHHAGLDRIGAQILQRHPDLIGDEPGRGFKNAGNAEAVLRRERGDGGHGKPVQCRDRLDVGLDSGAAAGIRTGDDKHAPFHGCSRPMGVNDGRIMALES